MIKESNQRRFNSNKNGKSRQGLDRSSVNPKQFKYTSADKKDGQSKH